MKRLSYFILTILALTTFFGCEQEDILFTEDMANVGFYGSTASMMEVDKDMKGKDTLTVQVLVTAMLNAPACEVTFDVDNSWYKEIDGFYYEIIDEDTTLVNPAMEGVDFEVLSAKTLTFSEGFGYVPVVVAAIDNNDYDPLGNKTIRLKITGNNQGYDLSSESVMKITIIDDDHPLGWLFGDYTSVVTATANGSLNHSVNIAAVDGEVDKVKIYGMAGSALGPPMADPYFILGSVSEDNGAITIKTEQEWGSWGYGPVKLIAWEDDNGEGEEVGDLIGTIDRTDGVKVTFRQQYTFYITSGGNEGLGIQWAWNDDANPSSPTAVWTKK
ncbi:MAG: hypothetical protein PHV35_11240 [Mariniphaga sp.]|nr:hypothetical protein [Mariniphaga sp.]MDD4226093.1 hypothetical protein [Mariniphaga sp.]